MAISSPNRSHAEFAAAFNAGDLDSLCDMYEAGAVLVPEPGAAPLHGIESVREALRAYLAVKSKLAIETVSAYENEGLALLRSSWKVTTTVEIRGTGVGVIRRQADGTWRYIIHDPFGGS